MRGEGLMVGREGMWRLVENQGGRRVGCVFVWGD